MKECSDSGVQVTYGRWTTALAIGALVLLAAKLVLAVALDPFGDEAFYWWESRHLAAGYTDVPPLLPWLLRLGGTIGHGTLGLRWPAVLIGAALPWLTYLWARRMLDRTRALEAAALTLCVPLGALLGVLALPDVPLTAAMLGAVIALDRASRDDRARDWVLLGICLALGWLSHYRFVMFYLAGAAFTLGTARGRATLARPGFWIAHVIGVLGLVPVLWFNFASGWAALRFQFVERHPWSFHADALIEPLVQLTVTTPLMFVLLLVAMWRARRNEVLLASAALALLFGYFVLDCFADATRVRFHWPLPAYLIALPALAALLAQWRARGGWRRALAWLAPASGALGTLVGLALLFNAVGGGLGLGGRALFDNLAGWSEIGAFAERERAAVGADAMPIAGDFLTGAEWAFQRFPDAAPYVLDHPLNVKHGRAGQLAIWGHDESGLRAASWSRGLLLYDDTAGREVDVLPSYRALCARFGSIEYEKELALRDGRVRMLALAVTPGRDADAAGRCVLPPLGYIDEPPPGAQLMAETAGVHGWAIAEFVGVAKVELLVDGAPNGAAVYGLDAPKVRGQWPQSADPNHPRVGFQGMLELDVLARGAHTLAVRIVDRDGRTRETKPQRFTKP